MAVSTLAALATAGTQWAVTAGFTLAMAVKTFAISFALSAVSRALAPKPQGDTATGLSSTVKSPTQARPIIYGKTRTAGTLIYIQTTGDDSKYLHMVQAMAGHKIDGYEKIYIDDELAWDNGTIQLKFTGKIRLKLYTGDQTTADADLVSESGEWTSTCVLNDTAYIYIRLEYDAETFNNGIPNITALVRGKQVYNPVTDVTEWTQNPALCIADYINDSKYGLTGINVDATALAESVGVCAQQVDFENESGQTQQHDRYQINGYIDTSEKVSSNIENMLSCMFGEVVYSQGKLHIKAGYYKEPVLDIDESVIVGDITLQTKQSKRSQYNGVKGVFLSSEENYTLADYPAQISSAYALEDGEPNYLDMTLPFTTDNIRAQRLAKLALGKSRQQRVITVPVNLVGLKIKAGDNVRINNSKLGLANAVYQVVDYELDFSEQLKVNLVCIETGASLYDWTVSDQQDFSIASDVQLWDGSAKPPTALNATSVTEILADGTTSVHIDVSWTAPDDVYFDYYVLKFGDSSITTKDTSYRISNVDQSGLYEISVVAYNNRGRASTELTAKVTNQIDTVAPSSPSSISLTAGFKQIELSWSNPTDNDFDLIEIKSNTENNEATSSLMASIRSDYYLHRLNANETRFYWLRALDRTGNASDWVYGGTGTTERLLANDFTDGVITIDFLDTSTQDTLTSVQNYTNDINGLQDDIDSRALQSSLDDVVNDTQRIDDTLDQASERLLQASLYMGEQVGIMRDAGITVDPDNGSVTIQAVETLRGETNSQFTEVGIDIDAIDGQLGLYATRTFVENEIAEAQLDPTEFTAFTDLQIRVNDVEIVADANEASLLLKASQTELDNLEGRVSTAESDIELNSGQIALKASQSDFSTLETRVNTAEININSIDAPSITQTVVATRDIYNELDKSSVQTLKDVLDAYKTRQSIKRDIAFTQQEISANVLDTNEAIASARLELGAQISDNTASIINEQNIRVSETSALAEDISQLQVDVGGNTSSITEINTVSADSDSAIARSVAQLNVDVDGNTADIQQINTVEATSDSAIARSVAQLTVDIGDAEADIVQVNTVSADSDSAIARTVHGINASITDSNTGLQANANAINGISTDVYNTDNGLEAVGVKVSSLSATVGEEAVFEQDAQPTNAEVGDLWKKTVSGVYNGELYQYNGSIWIEKDTNFANVTDSVIVKAVGESSNIASRVSTLSSTVGANTSKISTQQEAINGVKAQYSVTINNNGTVSGFGLVSDVIDGEPTSSFNVSADQFSLTGSTVGEVWDNTASYVIGDIVSYLGRTYEATSSSSNVNPLANPDKWDDITQIPFVVYTTDTTVNKGGEDVVIPKGVYIKDGFIQKASITDANIQSLNADKITAGTISTSRLNIDGVTLDTDASGNLIIAENGVNTTQIADNAVDTVQINDGAITNAKIDNLSADKITAGTISTSRLNIDGVTLDTNASGQLVISNEGVDTAQIAGDAVTVPTYIEGIQVSTSGTTAWTTLIDQTVDYGISVNAFISFVVTARRYIDGNSAFDTYSIRMKMYDNGTLVKQIDLNDLEGDSPTAINSFNSVPIMGGAFINSGNMRIVLEGRSENVATSKYYMKAQGFSYNAKR